MEDPNFTKMSPDYKKRYRDMIEKHNKDKKDLEKLRTLYPSMF